MLNALFAFKLPRASSAAVRSDGAVEGGWRLWLPPQLQAKLWRQHDLTYT